MLLEVLQKLGRHVEALELAVMSAPERVTELIGEGLDAASFLTSGSHTSYASKKLVEGRTAIDWLYQFFRQALGG